MPIFVSDTIAVTSQRAKFMDILKIERIRISVWNFFCVLSAYLAVCQVKDLCVDLLVLDLSVSEFGISCGLDG